jgi:hypothetical protein
MHSNQKWDVVCEVHKSAISMTTCGFSECFGGDIAVSHCRFGSDDSSSVTVKVEGRANLSLASELKVDQRSPET